MNNSIKKRSQLNEEASFAFSINNNFAQVAHSSLLVFFIRFRERWLFLPFSLLTAFFFLHLALESILSNRQTISGAYKNPNIRPACI